MTEANNITAILYSILNITNFGNQNPSNNAKLVLLMNLQTNTYNNCSHPFWQQLNDIKFQYS